MVDQGVAIKQSIDGAAKEIRKRGYFDVGILTDAEIEEVRLLIAHKDEGLVEFSRERASDPAIARMYSELSGLGLVMLEMGGGVAIIYRIAYWAVEKHDQRKAEWEAEQLRRDEHDREMADVAAKAGVRGAIVGAIAGGAVTVILNLLSWMLSAIGLPS